MTPFLTYLLKSSVSIALLFVLYKLAMSRDNTHKLNRYLLLGILIVSAFLPFVNLPYFQEKPVVSQVEFVRDFFVPEIQTFNIAPSPIESGPISESASIHINPLLFFYLLAIIFLLIKFVISVIRILQLMKKAEKKGFQQFILMIVKEFVQPFSFFKRIFISEADYESNKKILIAHEAEHIRQRHYIDLFFLELFTLLHWFNPFMWLLKSELKLVHEYQADQAVLQKGIDTKKYQLLVLEKAVGERRFAMANYFTQKPIQKRIKMMKKNKLYRWSWFKLLLFAPIVLLLLQAFARPEIISEKAGELVTNITQPNNSDEWIENWVSSKMEIIKSSEYRGTATDQKTNILYQRGTATDQKTNILYGFDYSGKNILPVLQNMKGALLVANKGLEKDQLGSVVESFIKGKNIVSNEEIDFETQNLNFVGNSKIPLGEIKFRSDINTPETSVEAIMRIIGESYMRVRNEVAQEKFNEDYFLLPENKKEVINQMVPIRFSLIYPHDTKTPFPPPQAPPMPLSAPPVEKSETVKPPPPNAIGLKLKKNGKVMFGKEEYNIDEIQQKIIDFQKERTEMYKKWDINPELVTSMKIEAGVSDEQVSAIKEALRKAKVQNLNLSFDSKKME